ncbi:MAG: hypothetical protein AAF703_14335 [Cyanobacteria bacterium P01_D01_bin.105]
MYFIIHNSSSRHVPTGISGSELLDSFSTPTQFTTLLKGAQVVDLNSRPASSRQTGARQTGARQRQSTQSASAQSTPGTAVPKGQPRRALESSSAVVSSGAIAAKRLTRTIASDRSLRLANNCL